MLRNLSLFYIIKRMSSTTVHSKTKTGFVQGNVYAAGRPSYTDEAVDYIADLITGSSVSTPKSGDGLYDVLELGAGTGKFTQKIITRLPQGVKYLATEPMGGFLDTLKELCPSVTTKPCTASNIPLPDNSIKSVIAAQCFHWFANAENLTEIRRVLEPGGRFVMVWNNKDWGVPWVSDIENILTGYYSDTPRAVNRAWKTVIENFTGFSCEAHKFLAGIDFQGDRDFVVNHFCTISVVASLPEYEKDAFRQKMYSILNNHDETRAKDIIKIPFETEIYQSIKV